MFETSLAIEALIASIVIGGSLAAAVVTGLVYRETSSKPSAAKIDDIIRTAPYDGLQNVLQVAKA